MSKTRDYIERFAVLVVILGLWEGICRFFQIQRIVLPPPSAVAMRLVQELGDRNFYKHLWATMAELLLGFGIGMVVGLVLGVAIALVPVIHRLLYPYIVAFQTLPKVAIAPLFVIWFGYGLTSKVVTTALVAVFPMLVNVITGFQSVDSDQVDMMRAFHASEWQIFKKLRLPSALPLIFAGLEIAVVFSVIGAVVGEFVGAQKGLGYLITVWNFKLDVAGVFAILFVLGAVGMIFHAVIVWVSSRVVFWVGKNRENQVMGI